jgi:uncharacterized protein (TIGR02594 family)
MTIYEHLVIALGEMGEKEVPGVGDNPRIVEYLRSVDMRADDEIPWCAAYVNWCLEEAGYKGTGKANAKSYLNWGYAISHPVPGAIVVFDRGIYKWQGHVGFFLDETPSYVYLLGGNQQNKVSVRAYGKERLVGYRWSSEFI